VVVGAGGSKPVVITAAPVKSRVGRYEWAPDSRTLLVNAPDDSAIWSFDTTTTAPSRTIASGAGFYVRPFQPPTGSSILTYRQTDHGVEMVLLRDLARDRACDAPRQRSRLGPVVAGWVAGRLQRRADRRSGVATPVHRECRRQRDSADHP
jgi:hypothetical protein